MTTPTQLPPFNRQNLGRWALIIGLIVVGLLLQRYLPDTPEGVPQAKHPPSGTTAEVTQPEVVELPESPAPAKPPLSETKSSTMTPKTAQVPPVKPSNENVATTAPRAGPSGSTTPPPARAPPGSKATSSNPNRTAPQNKSPESKTPEKKSFVFRNQTIRDQDGETIYQGDIDLTGSLERIESGRELTRFRNDGIVFQNREGRLPRKAPGYYHEYVHPTPGDNGPGPQRIVTGEDGDVWYTHDHYRSFKRVK